MKFIFVYNSGWHFLKGFEDLRGIPDVRLKPLSLLDDWRKKGYQKCNLELTAPRAFLWQFNFNKEQHIFILEHSVLNIWGTQWILDLQRRYKQNVKFILTLYDSMAASSPSLIQAQPLIAQIPWDCVYTFDQEEAQTYGWNWLGFSYFSSYFPTNVTTEIKTDAYFIGGLKGGREQLILDVANQMIAHNINCQFDLFSKQDNISTDHIHYSNRYIKYHYIQPRIVQTNCIIEILQQNQHCQSYRYFEAVYYNKKLLTNNNNIVHYPFYNPKYMRIFETPNQINYEWIKEKENINYGYRGEFSPIHLLEQIKTDIS